MGECRVWLISNGLFFFSPHTSCQGYFFFQNLGQRMLTVLKTETHTTTEKPSITFHIVVPQQKLIKERSDLKVSLEVPQYGDVYVTLFVWKV